MNNNIDILKLIKNLQGMDKKELEQNISKLNTILNSKQSNNNNK